MCVVCVCACVCVCNPWNHRDPFGFFRFAVLFYFTAGGLSTPQK